MLAVISDIHLTDESTSCNVDPGAFRYLGGEIATAVASREAEDLHILLLGDIFDFVRTDYWHRSGIPMAERPWGGTLDRDTAMNVDDARNEAQFLAVLDLMLSNTKARDGFLAMLNGLPTVNGQRPRVTYVIGNHDRVFHNYIRLRERLRAALPNVDLEFATEFRAPEYALFARHGHEYDEICHGWEFSNKVMRPDRSIGRFSPEAYLMMAIGEPITAELMSGFIHRVAAHFPKAVRTPQQSELLRNLTEVNNLRPTTDVFRWLAWFTKGESTGYEEIIFKSLKLALDDLLDCTLAERWDDMQTDWIFSGDLTDKLSKLSFALGVANSAPKLRSVLVDFVNAIGGKGETPIEEDELYQGARDEWRTLGDTQYQYLLYGHTHDALHRVFSARTDGVVSMYINTGTYLPLIQRTDDGKGFHSEHRMTIGFFYKKGEDKTNRHGDGPTVDLWTGFRRKQYVSTLFERVDE